MSKSNFEKIIDQILQYDLNVEENFVIKSNKKRGQSITFVLIDSNGEEKWIIKFFDYLEEIRSYINPVAINKFTSFDEIIDNIEDIGEFPQDIEVIIYGIELQKRCFDRYIKVGHIEDLICFPKLIFAKEQQFNNSYYGILVEEYVRGETLELRLKCDIQDKVMFVYDFLFQMGNNLKELSLHGIIHRDLSPDNIMLCNKKYVLIDPGVVKLEDGQLTHSRMILGKTQYASPEQYFGNAKLVTFNSDLYSVGIISLEILLGYNPLANLLISNPNRPHEILLAKYDRYIEDEIYTAIDESNLTSRLLLIIKKMIQIDDRKRFDSIDSYIDSLIVLKGVISEYE